MHKVSVIIATHNQLSYLKLCIESLRGSSFMPDMFVIADRPTKEVAEYLKAEKIRHVVECKSGLYRHWNIGIKATDSEYVLICNDDIVLAPYTIYSLVSAMDRDGCVKCVSPHMTVGEYLPAGFPDNFVPRDEMTDGASGACFLIPRCVIFSLGLFNEGYSLWGGDTEFFDRVRGIGSPPKTTCSGYAHHFGKRTVKSLSLDRMTSKDRQLYAIRSRWL